MASLRNLAITLLRGAGHDNITEALRHQTGDVKRPISLVLTA